MNRTGITGAHALETFAGLVFERAGLSRDSSLAELDYARECTVKREAFSAFWRDRRLPGNAPEIAPAPKPRYYRTTSKRKVVKIRGRVDFSMGYSGKGAASDGATLEEKVHGVLYSRILELLRTPRFAPLADVMNFCIVRGVGQAAVILNIVRLDAALVRRFKTFSDELAARGPELGALFLYVDESRSDYYFEAFRPRVSVEFKKLYGRSLLDLTLPGRPKLLYPPTVFSQVNEAFLPAFVEAAFGLLGMTRETRFLDLYCGYGLFSLFAAPDVHSVFGMDFEGPAIRAARANAEHLFPGKPIRFTAESITGETLERRAPRPDGRPEAVLLDPPRNGTVGGVAASVAARHPEKILAIHCGTDAMADELKNWLRLGFRLESARAFDLFPGSANLETMLLFRR